MTEEPTCPNGCATACDCRDWESPGAETYNTLAELRDPMADPDRDAERTLRMTAYREQQRRNAARALDRYLNAVYGSGDAHAAGEHFVEAVGDYVLSRLHHNSHYGVAASDSLGQSRTASDSCPTCGDDLTAGFGKSENPVCIDVWHVGGGVLHKRNYGATVQNVCPGCGRSFTDTEPWPDDARCLTCTHGPDAHKAHYGVVPPRPTEDEYASLPVLPSEVLPDGE